MTKLADNLKQLLNKHKINLTQLSVKSGIDKPRISRILSGKTTNPQIDTLRPIANFLKISLDQLVGDSPIPTDTSYGIVVPINRLLIPIIEWNHIPYWMDIKEQFMPRETIDAKSNVSPHSFAVILKTKEYGLKIAEGTTLVIDPTATLQNRDYFFTEDDDNKIAIKQFIVEKDKIFLKKVGNSFEMKKSKKNYKNYGVVVEANFWKRT